MIVGNNSSQQLLENSTSITDIHNEFLLRTHMYASMTVILLILKHNDNQKIYYIILFSFEEF